MRSIPDIDTAIEQLGPPTIASRIRYRKFVEDAERILAHFATTGRSITLKYIDPVYPILSVPAKGGSHA